MLFLPAEGGASGLELTNMTANRRRPLEGLRVVDVTQIWAGPQLCSSMGDMGAEVIRVESSVGTDMVRATGTQKSEYRRLLDSQRHARSRQYYISLNLATPEGNGLFKELISTADVFVCNLSPRVLEKLEISYERLRPYRPDLVMATISAAGRDGPWSDMVAFGPSMNAVMGSDSLVGYPDTGDIMASFWDPDPAMGAMGFYAVMLALYHRRETGEGQYIDLAFSEQLPDLIPEPILSYQMTGSVPGPPGNLHPRMAPHNIYPSLEEDTWFSIAVGSEEEWTALCGAMHMPEMEKDPRFADMGRRLAHRDELDAILSGWTRRRTNYEAMELLQAVGVAAAPALTIAELFTDPQDTFRRTSVKVDTPEINAEDLTYGIPWRLSETPGVLRRLGQPLGGDNQAFFTQVLGLSSAEIERLTKLNIIS